MNNDKFIETLISGHKSTNRGEAFIYIYARKEGTKTWDVFYKVDTMTGYLNSREVLPNKKYNNSLYTYKDFSVKRI